MSIDRTSLGLFIAHRGALVNYASGIVSDHARAEDVVQEAWLRFEAAGVAKPLDEPVSYLYRVVRNLAVDGRRRLIRERLVVESNAEAKAESTTDEQPSPEAEILTKDELRLLIAALDELPERTRIALEMRRFGGLKLREIADHLGLSVTTTHNIIAEGIAHCRRRVRPPTADELPGPA